MSQYCKKRPSQGGAFYFYSASAKYTLSRSCITRAVSSAVRAPAM